MPQRSSRNISPNQGRSVAPGSAELRRCALRTLISHRQPGTIIQSTYRHPEAFVSRSAEQVLEFDRLKEIVSGYTTCAPGRRAIEALAPQHDVGALGAEFTLIGGTGPFLRRGSGLWLRSLADPEAWLARLAVPASLLSIGE